MTQYSLGFLRITVFFWIEKRVHDVMEQEDLFETNVEQTNYFRDMAHHVMERV